MASVVEKDLQADAIGTLTPYMGDFVGTSILATIFGVVLASIWWIHGFEI